MFQKLSQRQHVLKRPDMYIGNINKIEKEMYLFDFETKKLSKQTVEFIPGVLKCFDEVFTNCLDHANRQLEIPVKNISVEISGVPDFIKIENNGQGIPIEKTENGDYIPEMIFSQLLSSSNYDDTKDRFTAGTNGLGVKLTNVFSKEMEIICSDGTQKYTQIFKENMNIIEPPKITKCKKHLTTVKWTLDWDYFKISKSEIKLYKHLFFGHAIIASLSVDATVKLSNTAETIVAPNKLKDFVNTFFEPENALFYMQDDQKVVIVPSGNQLGLVNGNVCSGVFVNDFYNQLYKACSKACKKTWPIKILKDTISFISVLKMNQPRFSSQSKEFCTTNSDIQFPQKFLNQFLKSKFYLDITSAVENLNEKKIAKKDGKKKSTIVVPKLDDATFAGTKKAQDCCIYLTEGDSAKTFVVSGFSIIGRQYNGVFPLKGKVLNVQTATQKQILENEEINNIKKILGLQMGKVYTKETISDLRYGHVRVLSDQDTHGIHIRGLVFNFFHTFWPELLKLGYLSIMQTPLIKATANGKTFSFYTESEFLESKLNFKNVKYYKGLGGSTSLEAKQAFKELESNKIDLEYTEHCNKAIKLAFGKENSASRKKWISNYNANKIPELKRKTPASATETKSMSISFDTFINTSLICYSIYSNVACIPDCIDGLKPSQRKILYTLFNKVGDRRIKVAQLGASVAEFSNYHHGEASLFGAIINLAARYPGSNNHSLLFPDGQFGSRITNGSDAASPRYIFTNISPFGASLFPKEHRLETLLDYKKEENTSIEPVRYYPVLPLALINGVQGIGTGYSTFIPPFNIKDIIINLKRLLQNKPMLEMTPFYNNFTGTIEALNEKRTKFQITCKPEIKQKTIKITEIPLQVSFTQFAEILAAHSDVLKITANNSTEEHIYYELKWLGEHPPTEETVMKLLKLQTSISLENMYLFENGHLKKFESPLDILTVFKNTRLEFLEKVRNETLSQIETELIQLKNQQKFINYVLDETLNLKMLSGLNVCEYQNIQDQFGLLDLKELMKLSFNHITQKELVKLEKKIIKLQNEKIELDNKTNTDIFNSELINFEI